MPVGSIIWEKSKKVERVFFEKIQKCATVNILPWRGIRVKLNADSEFLVHFELEPRFMGVKWAKSLKKAKKKLFL